MMTLVNMDSPGMVILPTHRVVHGLPSFSSAAFRDGASAYFSVEEVDPSVDAARAASHSARGWTHGHGPAGGHL